MRADFEDIPVRIFLDSSVLQTLQTYGEFIYDNIELDAGDPIFRDPAGADKLEALRCIMEVGQRAHFEFALSNNSFIEVKARGDAGYLQWAYEVLAYWEGCLAEALPRIVNLKAVAAIDTSSYNYLGSGDRALLKDALLLSCDSFLTMENRLPKNAGHIQKTLGIRMLTPIDMWELLLPWAGLFR